MPISWKRSRCSVGSAAARSPTIRGGQGPPPRLAVEPRAPRPKGEARLQAAQSRRENRGPRQKPRARHQAATETARRGGARRSDAEKKQSKPARQERGGAQTPQPVAGFHPAPRSRHCGPRPRVDRGGCMRSRFDGYRHPGPDRSRQGAPCSPARASTGPPSFPNVAQAVAPVARHRHPDRRAEIVIEDEKGVSSFSGLQAGASNQASASASFITYSIFFHLDGRGPS